MARSLSLSIRNEVSTSDNYDANWNAAPHYDKPVLLPALRLVAEPTGDASRPGDFGSPGQLRTDRPFRQSGLPLGRMSAWRLRQPLQAAPGLTIPESMGSLDTKVCPDLFAYRHSGEEYAGDFHASASSVFRSLP
jgi:hypothetical protein